MEIADSFRVSAPIADTWRVLLDIEGIAPCLPGAQLQEVEGDEYRGVVKVKVGPITAQYKGTATLAEVDEAARRIVIDASGRETRGQGNAKATIVVTMADDGGGTRVDVVTDLSITGKVAQFGRGVLVDVSSKLLGQFVENLERDVLATQSGGVEPAGAETAAAAAPEATEPGTGPASERRFVESKEVEPIDLLEMAGGSAARRLVPIGIAALLLFVLWRLARR
jgi:carbon monoxide dehydrogenase subunit G